MTKSKSNPAAPAAPAPAPAEAIARPAPLDLNENEGKWFHLCRGPEDGWFNFGQHGNPPFGWPVQLVLVDREGRTVISAGMRREEIIEGEGKERWQILPPAVPIDSHMLILWRPLTPAPFVPKPHNLADRG